MHPVREIAIHTSNANLLFLIFLSIDLWNIRLNQRRNWTQWQIKRQCVSRSQQNHHRLGKIPILADRQPDIASRMDMLIQRGLTNDESSKIHERSRWMGEQNQVRTGTPGTPLGSSIGGRPPGKSRSLWRRRQSRRLRSISR